MAKNIVKILFCFLGFLFFIDILSSQEENQIVVTDVKKTFNGRTQKFEIIINDVIKIKEVEVIKIANRTVVKYPVYLSRTGQSYPQVRILTKQVNDVILKAIETEKITETKNIQEPRFEITKFSPNKKVSSSRKIFATVRFNNAIEIECSIMEGISKKTGKSYKFVSWPSRLEPSSGKWVNQVILKKSLKQKVDNLLLKRYDIFKKESGGAISESKR